MSQTLGLFIGIGIAAVSGGVGSYLIWHKVADKKHWGKKAFFAFFSFFIGALFGVIGAVPVLLISYLVARVHKPKIEKAVETESSQQKLAS